jgi:hypothetical protein
MKLVSKQRGWSFVNMLAVLIVGGVFLAVGFKLAPAYADYYTLGPIFEDVQQDQELLSKSLRHIRNTLEKRYDMNNIKLPKKSVKVTEDKGIVTLAVDYEIRIPMFFNVDAVVSFKKDYQGQRP